MWNGPSSRNDPGFTLIELLVVVAIIVILAAVGIPQLVGALRNYRINGAARQVTNDLQLARGKAIMTNTNAGVSFVVADFNSYRLLQEDLGTTEQLQPLLDLPAGVRFEVSTDSEATGAVRFNRLGAFCGPGATCAGRTGVVCRSAEAARCTTESRQLVLRPRHGRLPQPHAARGVDRAEPDRADRSRRSRGDTKMRGPEMGTDAELAAPRESQEGFTLVEVMVAIVVLVFGLMAVTNLLLVAATSTTVANQSTAATDAAAACMERLRAVSFSALQTDGGTDWDTDAAKSCTDPTLVVAGPAAEYHCTDDVPGVGRIHTHWWITHTDDGRLVHIRVRSEGTGALTGARSRAEFTTFRSCTDADPTTGGCPLG